jgi:hypothetical protein
MSLTELSAGSFELERHIQRSLVMNGAFFVGIAQALVDQAEIDAGELGLLDRIRSV